MNFGFKYEVLGIFFGLSVFFGVGNWWVWMRDSRSFVVVALDG